MFYYKAKKRIPRRIKNAPPAPAVQRGVVFPVGIRTAVVGVGACATYTVVGTGVKAGDSQTQFELYGQLELTHLEIPLTL
jgi:hypothetical protein